MTELLTQPPPLEAIAAMSAIPDTLIAPSVLVTQQGPDGRSRPRGGRRDPRPAGHVRDARRRRELLGGGRPADGDAGGRARLHPAVQLPRRSEHHADRAVADRRRCAGVRVHGGAPRGGARSLPAAVAVQPLLCDLGDDVEPRPDDLLRSLRRGSPPRPKARVPAAARRSSTCTHATSRPTARLSRAFELGDEQRERVAPVGDDPGVGGLEDRCVGVGVDREHRAARRAGRPCG